MYVLCMRVYFGICAVDWSVSMLVDNLQSRGVDLCMYVLCMRVYFGVCAIDWNVSILVP
jgi:hypothetical protein